MMKEVRGENKEEIENKEENRTSSEPVNSNILSMGLHIVQTPQRLKMEKDRKLKRL